MSDRKKQAEEAAIKYFRDRCECMDKCGCDKAYLQGWADADSTRPKMRVYQETHSQHMRVSAFVCDKCQHETNPSDCEIHFDSTPPQQEVDEEAANEPNKNWLDDIAEAADKHPELKEPSLFCRAQNAEVERLSELVMKHEDFGEKMRRENESLRALLERAMKYADDIRYKRFHTDSPAGHNVWVGLHEDYERMKGGEG